MKVYRINNYTPSQQKALDDLMQMLRELEREYHEKALPILNQMADIEAAHVPKIIIGE